MSNENNSEIKKLLNIVADEEGIYDYKIEKHEGSVKGDGYLGVVRGMKIVGKDKANNETTLDLVVKYASNSDALRTIIPIQSIFRREIYMYVTVFPEFRSFEAKKLLPVSSFGPKFYKGCMSNKSESVILENLKESGYKMFERRMPMDDNHVSLVLTAYGRLHALSYAMRDQNPEKFKEIAKPMDDVFVELMKAGNFITTCKEHSIKVLNLLDPITNKRDIVAYKSLIDGIEPFFEELLECVDNYSAILHGDCWTNNMMFKYENSTSDKPTKVRLLDFQMSRMGPPVLDLAYFFYACSSKEIVNKLEYYLKLYHDSLSSYLVKLGSDPDKMFPYVVFKKQWALYSKFGLIMAAPLLHAMLSEKDETIDLAEVAESKGDFSGAFNYKISNANAYSDRMKHIVSHFVENNFI